MAHVLLSSLAIGAGAALGALLRWRIAVRLNPVFPHVPLGTLAVNVAGGYAIGVALACFARAPALDAVWVSFVVTGFLGGLTTFSAFSAEVVGTWLDGRSRWACAIVVLHVVSSVGATLLGIATVEALARR